MPGPNNIPVMPVRQVRVLQNVLVTAGLSALLLWFAFGHIFEYRDALLGGGVAGALAGGIYVWRLLRRVTRRDRRLARNKVLVPFLSLYEMMLAAAAASHHLLIALASLLLMLVLAGFIVGYWWAVLAGAAGLGWATVAAVVIGAWEWRHGPLHYQYDTRAWAGAEGMLYQTGRVIEPLQPVGTVEVGGERWRAVSASGERVAVGEPIEVLAIDGLTLFVERITPVRSL